MYKRAMIFTVLLLWLPISAHAASFYLSVPLEVQQKNQWCWAACASMVFKYRSKHFLDQCEIVEISRMRNPAVWGNTQCCMNSDNGCNQPHPDFSGGGQGSFRELLDHLNISAPYLAGAMPYATVKTYINASRPVIVAWSWNMPAGTGHAVVIDGYSDASGGIPDRLEIVNPAFGAGRQMMNYTAVVNANGAGNWWGSVVAYAPSANNITVYEHENFLGISEYVTANTANLTHMNNNTSSAIARGVPYILHDLANFQGTAWTIPPTKVPDYHNWNGTNDAVSSVQAMPNSTNATALIVFENENYTGASTVFNTDNTSLHTSGWGDRVSSMIVVSKIWNVYQDINYGGMIYTVTSFGGPNRDGFYPNPASWGGPDNDASSVYWVPESWSPIILYTDPDLRGRAVALWSSSPAATLNNLTNQNINNNTSSIKTFGNTWVAWTSANQTGATYPLNPNTWFQSAGWWGGADNEITSLSYVSDGRW